jgi:acyl-CoA synthetase (AMP-forming)/AMP-acid ligase II
LNELVTTGTHGTRLDLITGRLRAAARSNPTRVALETHPTDAGDDVRFLTFAEWDRGADLVADRLRAAGVKPGDQVGLAFENDQWSQFATACFGAYRAGATVAPLPVGAGDPRRRSLDGIVTRLSLSAVVSARPDPALFGVPNVNVAAVSDASAAGPESADGAAPEDVAMIDFTSGTTGEPKLVAFTHEDLAFVCYEEPSVERIQRGPTGEARVLIDAHLMNFHPALLLQISLAGEHSTLVVAPRETTVDGLLAAVESLRTTRMILLPRLLQEIARGGTRLLSGRSLEHLRLVQLTGSDIDTDALRTVAALMPHVTFMINYGSTESGPAQTAYYIRHGHIGHAGSVGRPVRSTEVQVRSRGGEVLPTGCIGAVWLRHPGAPKRRYYNPSGRLTEIPQDQWTPMGDLGYVDAEGYLYLTGRAGSEL